VPLAALACGGVGTSRFDPERELGIECRNDGDAPKPVIPPSRGTGTEVRPDSRRSQGASYCRPPILRGTSLADSPVQYRMKYSSSISLKTALLFHLAFSGWLTG
jgi:hypothetical protein